MGQDMSGRRKRVVFEDFKGGVGKQRAPAQTDAQAPKREALQASEWMKGRIP